MLANALYFKAAWTHPFTESATKPGAFHLGGAGMANVPTLHGTQEFGYAKEDGYTAVSLPYAAGFSMLLLVPDEVGGLPTVAKGLTAAKLSALARLHSRKVALAFPKFKIKGPSVALKSPLENLGMKLAFDPRSADFSAMTTGGKRGELFISEAFHKNFIAVDEKGTEAAAATAVVMSIRSAARPEEPVVAKIDRPFFYAIMDGISGTALFVGRVVDPR